MTLPLENYYDNIAMIHGVSGLFGKLTLGAILGAVATGNRKPGQQLLSLILGVQFLVAGYLAVSVSTSETFAGYAGKAALPIGGVSIIAGLAMLLTLFYPEGEWRPTNSAAWRRWAGWILIFAGFLYPFFTKGWIRPIFFAPVGVIPHPGLLIGGALAWMGMPDTNRLAAWTLGIAALAVGAIDVFGAGINSSLLLLAIGCLVVVELVRSMIGAGGIAADDTPRVDRVRREKTREVIKEKTKPQGKTWKLKG
ncbi:MAG: hypothetical protein PWP23_2161 [Candidatus Sumerlaeota bacterium]|nr:hypothetical protein [Candidatus Sumerlaeota bacterium]